MNKKYEGNTIPLSECCDAITDCHHSTPIFTSSGKLVIRNFNIKKGRLLLSNPSYTNEEIFNQRIARSIPEEGDLIITREAPMGEVCIVPDGVECCLGQRMVLLKPNRSKINNQYLLYALLSEYAQKQINQSNNTGSIVSNLRIPLLKELQIPLNKNQDGIALILSSLDKKIELNNQINQKLESMAKTLYDYWFVQFDFPDVDGKPYKSSAGKMVYSEALKREIPEGWEVFSLSSIVKSNYKSITKNDIFEEIEYLDTSSLTRNQIDVTEHLKTDLDKIPSRAKRIINTNDILYSTVRPNLCHYGIIKYPIKNMIASTGFVQLSTKVDWLSNDLIYTFLTSSWITSRLQQVASLSVSSYPSISANDILELNIVLPKEGKGLDFINTKLDNIYSKISLNQIENQKLTQLRDWLLPMLMNGQVGVESK